MTPSLPVLVMRFDAPHSFTGEDVIELLLPANPHLVERVLAALVRTNEKVQGLRHAGPGEFSARAYLNGKLTVEQAEGIQAIVAAQTSDQLQTAERLLTGETGETYRTIAADLADALALVEAGIDFTDQEDVVPIAPATLYKTLEKLCAQVGVLLPQSSAQEANKHTPRVVLVGPPNAGKSTLFNTLLGAARAVASDTPGTTRDVIEENAQFGANHDTNALLTDLAGLDSALAAASPVELSAQNLALAAIEKASVIILCDPQGAFDVRTWGISHNMLEGKALLRVRTKADQPAAASTSSALGVCSLDGFGLDALKRAIADALVAHTGTHAAWGVVPRHARSLAAAHEELRVAFEAVEPFKDARALVGPELIASAMRGALNELSEVAGEIAPDDVLGRVFAGFCVGK